ncbi:MAG: glycosyltransferase family 4 protein [Pyrinomonadaceae bacterium]
MRVLHFLDSLNRGGAEMQALDVCRNGARAGLDITMVAAGGGALEPEFVSSGVEFIKLQRKFPVDIYLASQLRRIMKEREIEIAHGYQAVDGIHLFLASRGVRGVRRVLSFQGFIQDKKNRIASRFLIPRMDANIAVSRGLMKWLSEVDGFDTSKNFTVIYNGADPERLRSSGRSIRRELGIGSTAPLFGMIANFYRDRRKDQFTVCRALPSVFAAVPGAHCIFAGGIEDGAEEKMADCLNFCLDNGLTDRVHFVGARSDVPDILAELDVFVLSSFYEGLPIAVSEAMLAGVPMVVSDIAPLAEATASGEFAEVFPVQDADALASKLIGLLADKDRRIALAQLARDFAVENFSIDAHLRDLVKLYTGLLGHKDADGRPH